MIAYSSMRKSELPQGWGKGLNLVSAAVGMKSHPLPQNIRRIVIFKLWAAGECLMATPVVAAIRARWQNIKITVVTGQSCEAIWRMCPGVDEIIALDEAPFLSGNPVHLLQVARSLRHLHADAAVILHHSYFFSIFSALAFPRARSGPNRHGEGFLYHFTGEPISPHRIDDHLAAAYALGAIPGNWHMTVTPPSSAIYRAQGILSGKKWLAVAPGGGRNVKTVMPQKIYPATKLLAALDIFHESHNYSVLLLGDKSDRSLAEELSAGLSREGIDYLDMCGKSNWEETAALISLCRGFVGNDSAPMHLAAALGIPTLGIFGATLPGETGPRGNRTAVVVPTDRDHEACYRHGVFNAECADPCIGHIEPRTVALELEALLG